MLSIPAIPHIGVLLFSSQPEQVGPLPEASPKEVSCHGIAWEMSTIEKSGTGLEDETSQVTGTPVDWRDKPRLLKASKIRRAAQARR